MKRYNITAALALAVLVAACASMSQSDKAKKQSDIREATQTTLDKFYQAKPELRDEVAKAPGYAVFTTYGASLVVGGAGGKGIAHDNKTNRDVFMEMGQASAGVQAGIAQSEVLIVFESPEAMQKFMDKGWEFGAGGTAQAGAGGKSVGPGGGENMIADAHYYMLTPNGLQAGVAVAGTKFWKDKELNAA
jgi:lipid-binding SYLF domain-containing protein